MERRELQHFFHEHPLIFKAEEHITNGGNDHPEKEISCHGCLLPISGPFYSCGECRYFLHKVCAELPSSLDHPLHPKHPLALLECAPYEDGDYECSFCKKVGSGLVYHCSVCEFDLDTGCAFPTYKIKDKCHPHPLNPVEVPIALACHICRVQEEGQFYKCEICPFWVHQNCTTEHSDHDHPYPFRALQHFFHEHPLILKAEEHKTNGGIDHPKAEIKCDGCRIPISGPFYSCGECRYFLHKVCAELPSELDHPFHPEHPLTLLERSPYEAGYYDCSLCKEEGQCVDGSRFTYFCLICKFNVDMKCASSTHVVQEKCHPHPLTPLQIPKAFALKCHICLKKEEGLSYKCNSCPFWVHQNCTLLPDSVKHSDHRHILTLLPSVPFGYEHCRKCDICYSKLFMFQCNYSCVGCLFFAHVTCARSETTKPPSISRDQNTDGQSIILLPMKQDSTDWISRFVRNYIDGDANIDDKINRSDHVHPLLLIDEETSDKTCDACAIPISSPSYGCVDCDYFLHKCCPDLPKQIDDHFFHKHPLLLIDEETSYKKTCDACAIRISAPYYGCVVGCDYFLHKCCTDLPKQIQDHPLHPQHQLTLQSAQTFIMMCRCCYQFGNSFSYKCYECEDSEEDFEMDIKCASIMEGVYHEAHKHPLLIERTKSSGTCTACGFKSENLTIKPEYMLQCKTCSFVLCIECAMAPAVIKHRYGGKSEELFRLTYSPPENHFEDEYLCEICMGSLNPKDWYYHCLFADQFAHVGCMVFGWADSNMKYEKSHMFFKLHEHEVTMIRCTYNCTPCSLCRYPMRICLYGGGAGYECKTCNFRRHLICPPEDS